MVNTLNVSAYSDGSPPHEERADLSITDGPLYAPESVLALLENAGEEAIIAWTRKCKNDIQNLSLDPGTTTELIREALREGQFIGSQWCVQRPDGPWAACDAYKLFHEEWVSTVNKEMRFEYYVKFAISKTKKVLLLVSCHLSN